MKYFLEYHYAKIYPYFAVNESQRTKLMGSWFYNLPEEYIAIDKNVNKNILLHY